MVHAQNKEIGSVLNASNQCTLQGGSIEDDHNGSKTITVLTHHQEYDAIHREQKFMYRTKLFPGYEYPQSTGIARFRGRIQVFFVTFLFVG